MKKRIVVMASCIALLTTVQGSLVLNGDFETPDYTSGVGPNIGVGGAIAGWTVVGSAGNVTIHHVNQPSIIWPGNSSQFMDLTGNTGGAGVQSAPLNTVAGTTYRITFDAMNGSKVWSARGWYSGDAFSVRATGGSLLLVSLNAGQIANGLSYTFTAAGNDTLTFLDVTGFDSNAGWIDNVSISAVPEPTTILAGALLLLPFAASTVRRALTSRTNTRKCDFGG